MIYNDNYNYRKYSSSVYKKHNDNKINNIISNNHNKSKFNIFDINEYINKIIYIFSSFNAHDKNMKELPKKTSFFVFLVIVIFIIVVWSVSGLYTIKEAERGVVLRFGKYHHLVQPGLNWKPTFIDYVIPVNVESVRELAASGMMLTSDENVVRVEMNVQYRVIDPKHYLFSVTDADDSLRQATDSALRGVIGKYNMDRILTEGRTVVRSDTRRILEKIIRPYNMGINLLDVNFQTARPPEEVKAAFDDAIAARENEQQYIREAEAYANEVQPRANGQAQRILEEGRAYKARTILEAQGEIQRFAKILPEYKLAPEITRERLYINSMERVLSNTRKIFIDSRNAPNMLFLSSLDQINLSKSDKNLMKNCNDPFVLDKNKKVNRAKHICTDLNLNKDDVPETIAQQNSLSSNVTLNSDKEDILNQRQLNAQRIDMIRKGRGDYK